MSVGVTTRIKIDFFKWQYKVKIIQVTSKFDLGVNS